MPSTPRKVPSGHGTKSSILYLHSLGVRLTMIVRLSGHPLVQDSLNRFPLRCKGGKPQVWSPEESTKRFHSGAKTSRPLGRQDGGHRRAHRNVTTTGFSHVKTTFVRISCITCPLSNPAVVGSLPPTFWKRTKATINRTSHHHRGDKTSRTSTHHTSSRTPHLLRPVHPLY